MKYSQELIQRIKDRIKLSDILSRHVALIPAGHMRFKALCPFHNEKTPSFVISDDKQTYHCFGCGAHGDLISFLTEKENYNFIDAVEYLAEIASVTLPKYNAYEEKKIQEDATDYEIINEFHKFFLKHFVGSAAENYIKQRGISTENIQKFALAYAPKKYLIEQFRKAKAYDYKKLEDLGLYRQGPNGYYFLFAERLIFPILNHKGKLVAFGGRILGEGLPKYINSPEYKFFKKRELLYNLYQAKPYIQKSQEVILCEGYMDVIAMQQAGFYNVVAPLGTAFSVFHLDVLWYFCDNPTICLDGDAAGKKAMMRIAEIAIPKLKPGKTLSFIILPQGKDPDDVLKTDGVKAMQLYIENRIFMAEMLVKEHCHDKLLTPEARSAALERLNKLAYKIEHEGVKTEYLRFFKDAFFKYFRSKSYYIKPKIANNLAIKTSKVKIEEVEFMAFISTNISLLQDETYEEQFALLDFEDKVISQIQAYLLANNINLNLTDLFNWLEQNTAPELSAFMCHKIKLFSAISLADHTQKKQFDYHYKNIILARLREDYQNNMRSGEESKQKLAIQLKHDINLLENELNQHLVN